MPRFREKPQEVEAKVLMRTNIIETAHWISSCGKKVEVIRNRDGEAQSLLVEDFGFAEPGQWIVRNARSEFYVFEEDAFREEFELIT